MPPVPCAVTDTVPADPLVVAVAVPPGVVFDPLAQPNGGGSEGYPSDASPPHGGGAVDAAATLNVNVAVAVEAGYSESATDTVNVLVVAVAVGVPVMIPLGSRLSPVGSDPPASDHV